jgi:glucose-1-phosphate adenylyltransferase
MAHLMKRRAAMLDGGPADREYQGMLQSPLTTSTLTIILAGGQGERLYPLTRDCSKPSVPFGGIFQIIDFTLSNCINSGLRRIYVLTQYKSHTLERHLKLGWNIFSTELGEYLYTVPPQLKTGEKWYQGTADALFQNINILESDRPERVLLLSGDHLYKMDYCKMLLDHQTRGADLTIACTELPLAEARRMGVMEVDHENRITTFHEKPDNPPPMPDNPEHSLVNMGVYVFNTDVLVRAVMQDAKSYSDHDFGKNIIPRLVAGGATVNAWDFTDENRGEANYWRDIGTLDSYYEASMDLVKVSPLFNLYDLDWPARTFQRQHPPAKFVFGQHSTGRVGMAIDSIISNGCIISGGHVERSVLSPTVRVNSFARVEDSILLDGVEVGDHAEIRRAIIDKQVKIPPGARIGFDPEEDHRQFTVTDGGIVVIPGNTMFEFAEPPPDKAGES